MFSFIRHSRKVRLGLIFSQFSKEIELNNINHYNKQNIATLPRFASIQTRNYCDKSTKIDTEENPEDSLNINSVTDGDPELEHRLKILMLEVEVQRQEGRLIPENEFMKESHWKELLKLSSLSQRRRYLEFLFKLSKKKENERLRKEEKRALHEQNRPPKLENLTLEEYATTYDLQHNSLFLRFYETTINDMYNGRLIQAMQFGQKLVIDCGYHNDMNRRENLNCAKQLMLLFADNRMHVEPFDLHFCNVDKNSELIQALHRYIPTMYDDWFPLNLHTCSYLDLFPKEQLVYLTPHCREEMKEYDHDAVYIIGGIVDKVNNQPLSLAKAKKEGLRMAQFPLDRYLQWGAGSGKSLTLNHVTSILLDMKHKGDWNYALRHVPRRKVVNDDESTDTMIDKRRKLWKPTKTVNIDNLLSGTNQKKSVESRRIRSLLDE